MAYTVKYCILYNNQQGHWDPETNQLIYKYKFKTLCKDCSSKYEFYYRFTVKKVISKKRFLKKFASFHKCCADCGTALYKRKGINMKTNFLCV